MVVYLQMKLLEIILTFAFDGDNLVVTNTAGGKVALSGYTAQHLTVKCFVQCCY